MRLSTLLILSFLLLGADRAGAQSSSEDVIDAGRERLNDNQQAQADIDQIHEETRSLVERYQQMLTVVEDLTIYNTILARQIRRQEQEMTTVERSIADAAVIERQVLPLLTRMVKDLEDLIAADMPFLLEERERRVEHLWELIDDPGISNAEKTRRVFQAFQIEQDYGNTIETYRGRIERDSQAFSVDFLRIGRVSLTYRTPGGDAYGYWNKDRREWVSITSSQRRRHIDMGVRMARQELAPELITLPVINAGEQQ